jgi:hypothetical protein
MPVAIQPMDVDANSFGIDIPLKNKQFKEVIYYRSDGEGPCRAGSHRQKNAPGPGGAGANRS